MDDVPYVGFVDTHTECNCRANYQIVPSTPISLSLFLVSRTYICVVECDFAIIGRTQCNKELFTYSFSVFLRKAIDNSRLSRVIPDNVGNILDQLCILFANRVVEVASIKAH